MDEERELYRNVINENLFLLFSDEAGAYIVRVLLLMGVVFGSALYFFLVDLPRLWVLLLLAFIYSYISAARYLKDLYELDDLGKAVQYMIAISLFKSLQPTSVVDAGKLISKKDEINMIERIGGPGILNVRKGNLTLMEKLTGLSRVIGKGKHAIFRYEFVKEVVSLDEQYYPLRNLDAVTVDGIRVRVPEIIIHFKLRERESDWTALGKDVQVGEAYRGSIKNFAYNRLVSQEGFMTLSDMVGQVIGTTVKKYINHHTIDQIITPEDPTIDSRQALKQELNGPAVRSQLRDIGARLVGLELGAFDFPDEDVNNFRLSNWKETKRGEIKVMEAEGRAYELFRQDAVRSKNPGRDDPGHCECAGRFRTGWRARPGRANQNPHCPDFRCLVGVIYF